MRKNKGPFPFDDVKDTLSSSKPFDFPSLRENRMGETNTGSPSVARPLRSPPSSYHPEFQQKKIGRWFVFVCLLLLSNAFLIYLISASEKTEGKTAGDITAQSKMTVSSTQNQGQTAGDSGDPSTSNPSEASSKSNPERPDFAAVPPSAENPVIALTFDDGPSPFTSTLLDTLREKDVRVTFFLLGIQVENHGDELVKRIVSEGHELGNHSYDHPILTKLTPDEVRSQLTRTIDLEMRAAGVGPTVFRPPTGAADETVLSIARDLNMYTVNWAWQSCPEDWIDANKNPEYLSNFVVENAGNGHVVLLHDIHEATVQSIPAMIDGLKEKGYRFATVSELMAFNKDGYELGVRYYLSEME